MKVERHCSEVYCQIGGILEGAARMGMRPKAIPDRELAEGWRV